MHHPIVGDKLYNHNKCKFNLNGQLLHAKKLILNHPSTGKELIFESKLPEYFEKVLDSQVFYNTSNKTYRKRRLNTDIFASV